MKPVTKMGIQIHTVQTLALALWLALAGGLRAQTNCAPSPAGVVSWWPGEGDTRDVVGTNNGSLVGGATFATGEVGQSFSFNGTGSYVQIPDSPSLSFTNDFTIEFWYEDTGLAAGAYGGLIAKRPFFGPCNFGLTIIGGTPGTLLIYLLDPNYNGGNYQGMYYNSLPAAGSFHHVAATFQQTSAEQIQLTAFVDGQLVQTSTLSGNLARTVSTVPVTIGASNYNGEFFKGNIDEVSIYGRRLSASEIASIYLAGGLGKCRAPIPAGVFLQPQSQAVQIGQNVTFTVGGDGTWPLSYQWSFNGTNIAGATTASLVLTNVQMSQAGSYFANVTNAYGSATSSNAVLVVNFPPATVSLVNSSGTAGQLVAVPVVLVANGNENALGFSLSFSPNLLTIMGVSLGTGANGAALQVNTNQTGTVGIALALPSGATFAPGTQEVAEVSFVSTVSATAFSAPLSFGDQPTKRELSDVSAQLLAVNFTGGQISLARSVFEADVAPRPNGDGAVTIVDWVQVGRFVAALDYPTNATEFQRADCAPRSTLGDGLLSVSDWVQAGRYAAGLDPLTVAGGPSAPLSGPMVAPKAHKLGISPNRALEVVGPLIFQGQTGTAVVNLEAQGDENGIGFSLAFDPTVVTYTSANLGADAASATMDVNAKQATNGQLGLILALPTEVSFSPGTRQVVKVNFQAVTAASINSAIAFTDLPVRRDVADTNAIPLVSTYANGTISVNPKPSLAISRSNQNINLAWPLWATNYNLQEALSSGLPITSWTNLSVSPVLTNSTTTVTLPLSGSTKFYRLQHQ